MNDMTQSSLTSKLADKNCQPLAKGQKKLSGSAIKTLIKQLPKDWKLIGSRRLEIIFTFPDFRKALAFTNHVGKIAEAQEHHPDVFLTYGEVRIQLSTHQAKGLTENDFILAAKISALK